MSDVAEAAAPGSDAGSAPMPALGMPSFAETATQRLTSLKGDPEWGAKYLKGDAGARNEMRSLIALAHGNLSDADQATLAATIKLERVPSISAGERQREAVQAAADATALKVPQEVRAKADPVELASASANMSGWVASLNLPSSTQRTVLDRIAQQGPRLDAMNDAERATWLSEQRRLLVGAAGSEEKAAEWFSGARKILAGSKYADSYIANDAWVVRHLAIVASTRKK